MQTKLLYRAVLFSLSQLV